MNRTLKVAPYQFCVACFAGDCQTAVGFHGVAEWIIAAINRFAGLDLDEATATLQVYVEQAFGCEPGTVPGGRFTVGVRLCRKCAQRTGAVVIPVSSTELPAGTWYIQPDDHPDDDPDGERR